METIPVVRGGALVCFLIASGWGGAAGQDSTGVVQSGHNSPVDSTAIDADSLRLAQYEGLRQAAADRLERGVLSTDEAERRALFAESERYARAAVAVLPEEADGYFLVAAALGMRTEFESVRRRIRMAGEVHAAALAALERDENHAGAHHVLGRLNLEAMRASGVARLIATHLFGSGVMRGTSWEKAEEHFGRAAELEPAALVHRLWLARLHMERGRREAARREFQTILSLEAASDLDRLWQREAGEELRRL